MNPARSLQARLIAAFAIVVVLALALASGLFVAVRRDDQEARALDRVAAAGPAIFAQFSVVNSGRARIDPAQFATDVSKQHDVRVLLLTATGEVALDSSHELEGAVLQSPQGASSPWRAEGSYLRWDPTGDSPASGLTLVTSDLPTILGTSIFPEGRPDRRFVRPPADTTGPGGPASADTSVPIIPTAAETYSLVLAVPESSITNAWLGLLPNLAVTGAIALVVAIAIAVLLARSIARPLGQLTVASQQVAAGSYNVDIETQRKDEVGRLGLAFATMAERVGASQAQMRSLVANVSHDLKTPLTSILGFSHALKSGAASGPDAERMGEIIHSEATRLSERLNALLYLSELDSGQALLRREPCDLGDLTRSVVDRVFGQGRPEGVYLDLALPDASPSIVDVNRLERALENLVENARKYTPEGGEIHIEVHDPVTICIANTAPHLTDEDIPRLFERFYRHDRTRTSGAGAGLGLPIAKDIAELHGGELTGELSGGKLVLTMRLGTDSIASGGTQPDE